MNVAELFSLAGHTALVTGSSRGIGRAAAQLLGKAGARVIYHASSPSARLNEAVLEAQTAGIKCCAATAELSSPEQVKEMLSNLDCEFQNPDILVLNASTQVYMHIEQFDCQEFQREMAVNVQSGYLLIQALLPTMQAQKWGRVISIGSVNQWKQAPRLTVYSATKCAQLAMILSLARSHAEEGITFNNVAPGVITTDRNAEALKNQDTVDALLKTIPCRRFGVAEDVAGTVLLLASNAGSYINGADIPVTGGMHL